jgi:hypothetical protein
MAYMYKLTSRIQLRNNLIVRFKSKHNGKVKKHNKVIRNVYNEETEFYPHITIKNDVLLKMNLTIVGERKWFLYLIPYNSMFKRL